MTKILFGTAGPGQWTPYAKRERLKAFFLYARDFRCAGQKTGSILVRAFLLGHALELLLKSYLLYSGYGEKRIKALGHNLDRVLSECLKNGLEEHLKVSREVQADLHLFNQAYSSKALEYFSILYILAPPQLPPLTRLTRFAASLEKALGSAYGQA